MPKLQRYPKILAGKTQLGPYPMEKLKRVDMPTTKITDKVERIVAPGPPGMAGRGAPGPLPAGGGARRGARFPIGSSLAATYASFPPPGARGPSIKSPGPEDMAALRRQMPPMGGEVASTKAPIPKDPAVLSRHIKSLGYFLGADVMGICRLPQYAVYSHGPFGEPIECNHQNAICIVVDQHAKTMDGSTGDDWISGSQSGRGYAITAFISKIMADYIRKLGYPARAHFSSDYQLIVTPLLLLAGIGEMSRAHVVLNPFLGLRFKVAVVTTDLPLEPDMPVDFGLQDFCQKCKKCATDCPSRSISMDGKVMQNGYENWAFNGETCMKYRFSSNRNGEACGRCIKVCPYNKPEGWTHDLVRGMIQHTPFMNNFIIKMDDVLGYGKQDIDYKWWFDLEERDGALQIPRKSVDYTPE